MASWVPLFTQVGVKGIRNVGANWPSLELAPGQWSWDVLDAKVQYLSDQNVTFGVVLFGNPSWNTLDVPGTLPVKNIAGWSRYVSQVATRLRGKVRCFEVWNEPPNGTGKDQTPADYAKIVRAAYKAIKAVDPTMRVGLAAKSAHVNYLELVIRAGARNSFDYITLHPYEILDHVVSGSTPNAEAVYLNIVPSVRRMLERANPERGEVPVVFSELGVSADKGEAGQASALVKAYVMGLAQGVAAIQWFEARDGDSGPLGLLDARGKPRAAFNALATLIEYLGERPVYRGWALLGGKHPAFVFDGPRGTVAVAWTALPTVRESVAFAVPVTTIDPLTGSVAASFSAVLGRSPLLLSGLPPGLVVQATSNRDHPVHWGPDYSDRDELFIDYANTRTSGGLYTLGEVAVADSVRRYGGSARAGAVPGGNFFVIHPSFLEGGAVPLEITVVARRASVDVEAGFNLKYEARSPSGFKNAGGWYAIPRTDKWHTKTWRINDAQFVNYWGYNFVLDSDGVHNGYTIRSIRVRKVGSAKGS